MCCFTKHQNLVVLTVIIYMVPTIITAPEPPLLTELSVTCNTVNLNFIGIIANSESSKNSYDHSFPEYDPNHR